MHGGNSSIYAIQKHLNRGKDAIKIKATRLGLKGATTNSYKYITACKASKILGIDRHKVCRWINDGVLKAKYQAICKERKMWCIKFEDFIVFLKNNQNLWDSRKLEEYSLGYEYEWLKKKRFEDRRQNGRNNKNNNKYVWKIFINIYI